MDSNGSNKVWLVSVGEGWFDDRRSFNGMSGIALTEDVGGVYGLVEVRVADVWAWGDLDRQMM